LGNGTIQNRLEDRENLQTDYSKYSKQESHLFSNSLHPSTYHIHSPSKLQLAEMYFRDLQKDVEKIISVDVNIKQLESTGQSSKAYNVLCVQNKNLLKNLDKINEVLKLVVDSHENKLNKYYHLAKSQENVPNPKEIENVF